MGRKIQAVFFDMGGTIETFGYTRQLRLEATPGIQQILLQGGVDLQLDNEKLLEVVTTGLDNYKRTSIQTLKEYPPSNVWCDYIFTDYAVDREKLSAIAEELSFFIETRFYKRAMRTEMPAVLEKIKQMRLKIGLISNVNSRGQVPTNLKNYNIIQYFDPIVLSSEYGVRKPDPAIFHYAARLANVPTSACVYIGDRILRDVDGAQRAGYGMSVQIIHDFEHGEIDEGATPNAVIRNMTELINVLQVEMRRESLQAESTAIRALIFDAGDILYFRPERGSKFAAFLKEMGMDVSSNHNRQKKEIEHKAYRGQIDQNEYREAIVKMYGITQPDLLLHGKQALIDDDANVTFFEGVPETLLNLKAQGYMLGIITDTANSLSAKLNWFERGGLGHVWDSIISSMDLGVRKPDPQIYLASLRQLGITPQQAIFIGHRSSELAGARAVGMQTIGFNYDQDAQADMYIEKFADLLNIIKRTVNAKT